MASHTCKCICLQNCGLLNVWRGVFGYEANVPISLTMYIRHKKYCKIQTPSRHVLLLAETGIIERDQELHFITLARTEHLK